MKRQAVPQERAEDGVVGDEQDRSAHSVLPTALRVGAFPQGGGGARSPARAWRKGSNLAKVRLWSWWAGRGARLRA